MEVEAIDEFNGGLTALAEKQEDLKNKITLAYQIAPVTGNDNALAAFAMLKWRSTQLVRKTLETNHRNTYNHTIATNKCEKRAIASVVAQLKRAFNKGDETTSDQSKQCTHEMLSKFAQDTEKGLQILQTYRLKVIDLKKQRQLSPNTVEQPKTNKEISYTEKLCQALEDDLEKLPTKRSLATNTMSRQGVLERFAHMESHNNMCQYMIRQGNKVENDRFVNMTNASFNIIHDYLSDGLAIMGTIALDGPDGPFDGTQDMQQRDIAMHACPLLCVVPTQKTIDEIYHIIQRLHVPFAPVSKHTGQVATHFQEKDGLGTTSVSTSSGHTTPSATPPPP